MQKQTGIWIDHREAFVVFMNAESEATERIESGMEKHVRYAGGSASSDGKADDQRDRQYAAHLEKYYDNVITHIRDAQSILLFGPGEAKSEFKKRLDHKGLGARVVGIETTDKMTDNQIAAKVRLHFHK
jgi:stalled ribosome rescue protein Dom34